MVKSTLAASVMFTFPRFCQMESCFYLYIYHFIVLPNCMFF